MDKFTYLKKKNELKKKLSLESDDELIMWLIQIADLEPVAVGLVFSIQTKKHPEVRNLLGLKLLHSLLSHYLYPQKY